MEGHPLGGARMARGETGATVFSIPDAPDLSPGTELPGRYGLGQVGEARYVRERPGATLAGRDELEVLAFGSHVPGDGEMVSDWPAS